MSQLHGFCKVFSSGEKQVFYRVKALYAHWANLLFEEENLLGMRRQNLGEKRVGCVYSRLSSYFVRSDHMATRTCHKHKALSYKLLT